MRAEEQAEACGRMRAPSARSLSGLGCGSGDGGVVCDGSRLKGDGSGNTAGLLPLSDSILWVSEEHSLFVLAPVGFSRASAPCFHYTWQTLCLFCLLSPCAPARGKHNTTVRNTWEAGWGLERASEPGLSRFQTWLHLLLAW